MNNYYIVDYSPKAFAIPAERQTALSDEFQALGGRFNSRLKFGPGWIFSKSKNYVAVVGMLNTYGVEFSEVALSDIVSDESAKPDKVRPKGESMPDYILTADEIKNKYSEAVCGVRLSDGVLLINKERLQTVFWFGYSDCGQGPTEEEANASANAFGESDFINKNTERLRDALAILKGESSLNRHFLLWKIGDGRYGLHKIDFSPNAKGWVELLGAWERKRYNEGEIRKMTDEERERLIACYNIAIEQREKQCKKYLKRYGLSKLDISTYWMDR